MKRLILIAISIALNLIFIQGKTQDLIVKIKGDTIVSKVLEVGTSTISYKKSSMLDGPTFVINKMEVVFIKYANGEIQEFLDEDIKNNPQVVKNEAAFKDSIAKVMAKQDSLTKEANQSFAPKNKIDFINNKYYVNGKEAKLKDVNTYLSQSKNPAISMQLKGASGMAKAQKIMKITSYPTTITGGFTSLFTIVNVYQLKQRGRLDRSSVVKMAFSMFGTAVFPITSKILKKSSDKKYNKLIDMYNETN